MTKFGQKVKGLALTFWRSLILRENGPLSDLRRPFIRPMKAVHQTYEGLHQTYEGPSSDLRRPFIRLTKALHQTYEGPSSDLWRPFIKPMKALHQTYEGPSSDLRRPFIRPRRPFNRSTFNANRPLNNSALRSTVTSQTTKTLPAKSWQRKIIH